MSKPLVLIIEDDETIVAGLRSVVNDECEVFLSDRDPRSVAQGQERQPLVTLLALESRSRLNPDDGLRILRQLRLTGHKGKVIVYTSSCERSVAVRAVGYGAMEVLSKPLDLMLIKGIVSRALRIADLEREAQAVIEDAHDEFKAYVRPTDMEIYPQIARYNEGSISLKINQQRIETDLIVKAFTLSQGNLSRAAHELGISRSTLYRRLRQYGMDRNLDARRTLGFSPQV